MPARLGGCLPARGAVGSGGGVGSGGVGEWAAGEWAAGEWQLPQFCAFMNSCGMCLHASVAWPGVPCVCVATHMPCPLVPTVHTVQNGQDPASFQQLCGDKKLTLGLYEVPLAKVVKTRIVVNDD